jgi:hypothetical protein
MDYLLELFSGIFFQPRQTMERLAREQPLGSSVLLYLIIALLNSVVSLAFWDPSRLGLPSNLSREFLNALPRFMSYGVILSLIFALFTFLIMGAVFHLVAELMGGRGSVISLLSALGFASLPSLLNVPVTVIVGFTGLPIGGLLTFLFAVWVIVLQVFAVQAVYKLTTGKSVLMVLTPIIALMVAFIFALVLFFIIIGSDLMELAPIFNNFPTL